MGYWLQVYITIPTCLNLIIILIINEILSSLYILSIDFDAPSDKVADTTAIQDDWFNTGADLVFRNNLPAGFSYAKYKPKVCRNDSFFYLGFI